MRHRKYAGKTMQMSRSRIAENKSVFLLKQVFIVFHILQEQLKRLACSYRKVYVTSIVFLQFHCDYVILVTTSNPYRTYRNASAMRPPVQLSAVPNVKPDS